jgi:RNA polymerase sigma factor (sigma-70 family)
VNARNESNKVLIDRLLPSTNRDPQDRAIAWEEWYANGGRSSVMAFVRAKNNTREPDADILQEAVITAYTEVERGRRRIVPLDDASEFEDDRPQMETVIERHEQQRSLHSGLSKLTPGRRRVLEGYLDGHTTAEIAQALGMSEESVRQHKCRGLRSLRRSLRRTQAVAAYL